MNKSILVSELVQEFGFVVVNPEAADLTRRITTSDINRPGLALAGFLVHHPAERVQVIGRTETDFMLGMEEELTNDRAELLCSYEQTPALIVTRQIDVLGPILQAANRHGLPILQSSLSTTLLFSRLQTWFDRRLAKETTLHGVLVDVYGIGILIQGTSGIGKSETALELVKRGHRLVADDAVEIKQLGDTTLEGTSPDLLRHLMEIRGLGVLNVMTLFGAGAVRMHKDIEVVIHLQMWDDKVAYDRLGLDEDTTRILDVDVPLLTLPVRPGRNLAVILEVAAMNYRLKRMGYNAAKELTEKMTLAMEARH